MAEWCLIIHMYHSFFIHSSVDGISVLSNFFQDSVMRKQWLSLTRSLSNKGNLSRHWHLDANRVTATASSPVDPVKAAPVYDTPEVKLHEALMPLSAATLPLQDCIKRREKDHEGSFSPALFN